MSVLASYVYNKWVRTITIYVQPLTVWKALTCKSSISPNICLLIYFYIQYEISSWLEQSIHIHPPFIELYKAFLSLLTNTSTGHSFRNISLERLPSLQRTPSIHVIHHKITPLQKPLYHYKMDRILCARRLWILVPLRVYMCHTISCRYVTCHFL